MVTGFGGVRVLVFVRMPEGRKGDVFLFRPVARVERPWIYKTGSFLMGGTMDVSTVTVSPALDLPHFSTNTQWRSFRGCASLIPRATYNRPLLQRSIFTWPALFGNCPWKVSSPSRPKAPFDRGNNSPSSDGTRQAGALSTLSIDGGRSSAIHVVGHDSIAWHGKGATTARAATLRRTALEDCKTCHSASGLFFFFFFSIELQQQVLPAALRW